MVETSMGASDDCRHAVLQQLLEARRVVAERLDRDAEDILVRRAGNGERMAVPAVLGFDVDHGELARKEFHLASDRPQRDLNETVIDLVHGVDLVVVQREKEAGEQFPVDVEPDPDRSDRHIRPAQDGSVGKGRPVERAVRETGGDEESRGSVQCPPSIVVAEHAANVTNDGHVSPGKHQPSQGLRRHRLPTRQDRPRGQSSQPDRSDRSERSSERRAVWT